MKILFHQNGILLRMLVGLFFSWRLWKMEKFRVPSVHHHSWWNKKESHTRKQGMATQHYIFKRCRITCGFIKKNTPEDIYYHLIFTFFTLFLHRKKQDAMTLTSHTGLQISPGRKSTIRKLISAVLLPDHFWLRTFSKCLCQNGFYPSQS